MNEFIQKKGEEVSIVIYDAPLPPKYFRVTKRFIKTLFVVVPLLITSVFLALFLWGLGSRLKETPAPTLPSVMNEADARIEELEAEVKALQTSNQDLANKVAQGPAVPNADDPFLGLIKKPYGMQNLMPKNKVSLDQFEVVQKPDGITLKFQIISSNPETRVTGHVLVFMVSGSGIIAYPPAANSTLSEGIKYSMGETFAVSRLRPTNADFLQVPSGDQVKFLVYIFNREGDLLLIKETASFKIGAK